MSRLSRTQKTVLLVLAILDIGVIGGLSWTVIKTQMNAAMAPPLPQDQETTERTPVPTWTPTPSPTAPPTLPPRPTNTPTPTATPVPTLTPTPTPTPLPPGPVPIQNGDFNFLLPNRIPGWTWDAFVNYKPGDEFDPETSYAEPMFTAADDPVREIHGATLKVETIRWLKFRTWVHQTVTVTAGSQAYFRIKAKAFSSINTLIVKAGIDPTGADNCYGARWGTEARINQDSGTVTLTSPRVIVPAIPDEKENASEDEASGEDLGRVGRVTLCFFAEPAYAHVNNAAFFDQAELIVAPP